MLVFLDESQKLTFLLSGNGFPGDGVVHDDRRQLEAKRILAEQIVVYRHLKSRPENTSDGVNRTVPFAIHLLKLDQPCLCIRQAYLVDALLAKRIFLQNVDHGLVSGTGIVIDSGFEGNILFDQLDDRIIAAMGNDVVKQVRLDLFFLFSQRKFPFFTPGCRIILVEAPAVYPLLFTVLVNIAVPIPPVCTLVFAFAQNPVAFVSSFFAHRISPFKKGEPDLR